MNLKLKALAVATVAAFSTVGALAADTDWSAHDGLESALAGFGPGLVADSFSFTLDPGFTYAVTSNVQGIGLLAPFAFYGLFNADNTVIGSYTIGSGNHTELLGAGSYKYSLLALSANGGAYSVASAITAVTPVPEPETYAMMLAGLAAVGFLASRRHIG